MRPEELKTLIHRYVYERVEEWEDAWYNGENPAAASMSSHYDDSGSPSEHQWQDHLSAFSLDSIKDHAEALRKNDLSGIERTAQEFIQRYSLRVERGSPGYRLVCRELLKAEQTIAKTVSERVQGNYVDAYGSSGANAIAITPQSPSQPAAPSQARLFSVAIKEYLKHYEKRAPATLEEKQRVLGRFMLMTDGDRPVHLLTKQQCIKYRDELNKEVSRSRVNTTLAHIGHFLKWCTTHEHYPDMKSPSDGLAYDDAESVSFDPFTVDDIQGIFGSEEYRQQLSDGQYARYFLPLILLHTAARREEVAGLPIGEVKQDGGIYYLIFPRNSGHFEKGEACSPRR